MSVVVKRVLQWLRQRLPYGTSFFLRFLYLVALLSPARSNFDYLNKHLTGYLELTEKITASGAMAGNDTSGMPRWLADYLSFHNKMRHSYPGEELFTNTSAPKILVRTCFFKCGGLNDRVASLPFDLYLANLTNRLLLIKWTQPCDLQHFLAPAQLDWTVPEGVGLDSAYGASKEYKYKSFPVKRGHDFESSVFKLAMERALHGDLSQEKVLMTGGLISNPPTHHLSDDHDDNAFFRTIFHALFKPSLRVQERIDEVRRELELTPGKYSAVHSRVRHPKGSNRTIADLKGRVSGTSSRADAEGLDFHSNKEFAVGIASRAIRCLQWLLFKNNEVPPLSPLARNGAAGAEPIYFYSDSNDTTAFMSSRNPESPFYNSNSGSSDIRIKNIVVRDTTNDTLHIDKQLGSPPHMYYDTFVDLFIAAEAKCISYGVGSFGRLAAKLSGTNCQTIHRENVWNIGSPAVENITKCPKHVK